MSNVIDLMKARGEKLENSSVVLLREIANEIEVSGQEIGAMVILVNKQGENNFHANVNFAQLKTSDCLAAIPIAQTRLLQLMGFLPETEK